MTDSFETQSPIKAYLSELLSMRLAIKPMDPGDTPSFISIDKLLNNPLVAYRTLNLLDAASNSLAKHRESWTTAREQEALNHAQKMLEQMQQEVRQPNQSPLHICKVILPKFCAVLGALLEEHEEAQKTVRTAIRIRAAYAAFHRSLRMAHLSMSDPVERLRVAVSGLQLLLFSPAFKDVRIQDRIGLRLMMESCEPGHLAPEHAWEALKSYAEELRMINRRGELVEHDNQILHQLNEYLGNEMNTKTHRAEITTLGTDLIGLDDQLDEAFDGWTSYGDAKRLNALRERIHALLQERAKLRAA